MQLRMFEVFCIFLATLLKNILCEVVDIEQGSINGTILYTRANNSFHAFLGIPYAAPPVGSLRFQSPKKPQSWEDVRQAINRPPECLHFRPPVSPIRSNGTSGNSTEDCLYINVFTRELVPKKLKPVLVHIHGGGFRFGSTDIIYGPHLFMDEDVVVVSFNHRVGIFGYLSSGDEVMPGNYGLKDQVKALKWIRKNINKFGGDRNLVTLLGHNSGAACVHLHTVSELSRGLFHRAIMQSGNAIQYLRNNSTVNAKTTFQKALQLFNCTRETTKKSVLCLRGLPADILNSKGNSNTNGSVFDIPYHPVFETSNGNGGAFLMQPYQYRNPPVPLIIGMNSAEGKNEAITLYLQAASNMNKLNKAIDQVIPKMLQSNDMNPNDSEIIKRHYFPNGPISERDGQNLSDLIGDIFRSARMMETLLTYPGKAFFYVYDYKNNVTKTQSVFNNRTNNSTFGIRGTGHGDETISLFQTADSYKLSTADRELSKQMIKYWVNFMISGSPNRPRNGLKRWRPRKPEKLRYLHISQNGFKMKYGSPSDGYNFLKSLN